MFCNKCGKEMPDDSKFCPACGAAVGSDADETAKPAAAPEKKSPKKGNKLLYTVNFSCWMHGSLITLSSIFAIVGLGLGIICFSVDFALLGVVGTAVFAIAAAVIIIAVLSAKSHIILIYENRIVSRYGLISKHENYSVMTPIIGVSVSQGVWGKICNYGYVHIDKMGKGWDISTDYVKDPNGLKHFLSKFINETDYSGVKHLITD